MLTPTREELRQIFDNQSGYIEEGKPVMWFSDFAAAVCVVLARWRDDAAQPIPISGRKPALKDCDGGLVWAGCHAPGLPYWEWCLDLADLLDNGGYTHWLPTNTHFLPARVAS
jgi:hypothetical protein